MRIEAIQKFLEGPLGGDVLAVYKRSEGILETQKGDEPTFKEMKHPELVPGLFEYVEEHNLYQAVERVREIVHDAVLGNYHERALNALASLRESQDAFVDRVLILDPEPQIRLNRLKLLSQVCEIADLVADFSQIEA